MVTYARFLLYSVLSICYGQVKLQDVYLTCPESDLFNGTQINLTCTVSTSYSSKCAAPVQEAEFRVSYDENAYTPLCKIMDVSQCDFNPNSEGCGCVNRNNTHYTLKYTFIGVVSHNITWDCLINCLDDSLNPALTYDSKFCKRRNVESIPEHTTERYSSKPSTDSQTKWVNADDGLNKNTVDSNCVQCKSEIFKSPGNGDQSLDTGLIIGIAVGVTLAVAAICIVVVLMFNKKNRLKSKGSDIETPVHKPPNENQEKETDKLLSTPVQKESESKIKLEKNENNGLSKPVQEETKSNVKQEKETDKLLSTPAEKESESKEKLEKKENNGLSKPVQEETKSNENQEKETDKLLSTPVENETESKEKLKKENEDLSKPVQEQTEINEKKDDSKPILQGNTQTV